MVTSINIVARIHNAGVMIMMLDNMLDRIKKFYKKFIKRLFGKLCECND